MTEATFHVYFFNTNQAVVTAPISQHDQVGVYATIRVKNWTDGFINVIAPLYQTLLTLVPAAPSPLTTKLKETFDFFSATAEQLKQSIEKFLTEGDSQRAINYMERCAKLFMGQGNFIVAGDYYKWAGYTNFESGNMEKSAAFYNKAIDMHRRGGDQQKVVEDYSDLASVLESSAKTREALENYAEALKLAKQLGNAEVEAEVNENINRVITPIANEMQDYINKDSASSHQLSRLAQRFDLPEHLVILTLEFLIKNQLIMGYVDTNSRMYTKRKEALPELKQEQVVQSVPTGQVPTGTGGGQPIFIAGLIAPRDVPQYNYQFAADQVQKIQADNSRTNSELTKIETEFKRKNVKITDFLKYQTYLNKKKLNDQQLMIYDNMLKLNADNGQPILCFVCLNTIESDDVVSVCPNGHGAHDNCLATWIQTQQKCPVCSEKIMPFMLQLTYAKYSNAIFNPGYVIGLQKEVESLNERLKFLNTLDKNNLDLFNKATAEREDKRQLEKLLNRKEQEIEELKNMMNSYKNQLSRRRAM